MIFRIYDKDNKNIPFNGVSGFGKLILGASSLSTTPFFYRFYDWFSTPIGTSNAEQRTIKHSEHTAEKDITWSRQEISLHESTQFLCPGNVATVMLNKFNKVMTELGLKGWVGTTV